LRCPEGTRLLNIDALVKEANRLNEGTGHQAPPFEMQHLAYKVYVRHPEQLTRIQSQLQEFLGEPPPALYLNAEVCRQDLAVEIEALGRAGR
jgi:chorismate lyase/3-hydroxybenzoate synthase